ncbi:MAG TPA: heme utilization cystosolic carrier protein HutX [Rhodoblastus sp.]|nr:heme utilization cystosolic carrier protein HutX [Rhodoblastus sp.]
MSVHALPAGDKQANMRAARADIDANPDGVLEAVAEKHGLTMHDVLGLLPEGQATRIAGARFEDVWRELASWGDVLFLLHNQHGVFEIKTALPQGSFSRGYFNIHGETPLGGHLRAERCGAIWFVDRPFFGRRSCSVQFLDSDGAGMFKIFVRRDAARELDPGQLAKFEAAAAAFRENGQ